jgi:hypothetical protein
MLGTTIAIDVPDARRALSLERRLGHLHPIAVGTPRSWVVDVHDADDHVDEVFVIVRRWLDDAGLEGTTVRVNGAAHWIGGDRATGALSAADYEDGEVLAHEP